jgi:hypothetical protein
MIQEMYDIVLSRCKLKGISIDDSIAWLRAKIERSWVKIMS